MFLPSKEDNWLLTLPLSLPTKSLMQNLRDARRGIGTVKKYSIPRQFFKVVYDDGDVEEYDFEELMVIIIGEK